MSYLTKKWCQTGTTNCVTGAMILPLRANGNQVFARSFLAQRDEDLLPGGLDQGRAQKKQGANCALF
jgi:hypothetical protein